jgi:glycosyltransferase involved in cell wall biosynthesis
VTTARNAHESAVTVLTPWFPNRPGDRDGNFIYDSVTALERQGVANHVLVARRWKGISSGADRYHSLSGNFDADAFAGLSEVRLKTYFAVPRNRFRRLTAWSQTARLMPLLKDMIEGSHSRALHAHTEAEAPLAIRAGKETGVPVVVTLHGINRAERYLDAPAHRQAIGAALRAAERVVLVGEPLRDFFREIAGRDDHFRVVPNGVTLPKQAPIAILQSDTVRLISVGNLHEGKGIDLVLEALMLLDARGFRNWTYVIVGDGPEREKWKARAASSGLSDRVVFRGAVTNDKVWEALRAADIFVLPSYIEAFGVAYLEAMATGLLTIGVRGQGPSAYIADGETGLLVAPRDASSVAEQLLRGFDDRASARAIAEAGSRSVRQSYGWDAHAARLINVYKEVAAF